MSFRVSISGRYALWVFAAALCLTAPGFARAQISVGRSEWNVQGRIPPEEIAIVEQQLGEVAGGANLKLQTIGACTETTCTLASLASGQSRYIYLQIEDAEDKGMRLRLRVVDAINNRPLATRSVFIQKNDRRGTKSALEVTIRDVAFHLFGPPVPEALRADSERKLAMQNAPAQAASQPKPAWAGQPAAAAPEVVPVSAPADPPRIVPAAARAPDPVIQRQPDRSAERPVERPVEKPVERVVPEAAPPARAPEPPPAAPVPAPVQVEAEPEPARPEPSRPEPDHTASDRIVPDKIEIPYLP